MQPATPQADIDLLSCYFNVLDSQVSFFFLMFLFMNWVNALCIDYPKLDKQFVDDMIKWFVLFIPVTMSM